MNAGLSGLMKNNSKPECDDVDNIQPFEKAADDGIFEDMNNKEIMLFDIPLNDSSSTGLGLSVKARTQLTMEGPKDLGIFINDIISGGTASKDGRLNVDDQLLNFNSEKLTGIPNSHAMTLIRRAMHTEGPRPGYVCITVARPVGSVPIAPLSKNSDVSYTNMIEYDEIELDKLQGNVNDFMNNSIDEEKESSKTPTNHMDKGLPNESYHVTTNDSLNLSSSGTDRTNLTMVSPANKPSLSNAASINSSNRETVMIQEDMYTQVKLPSVISLNVGGKIFATRLSTLRKYPNSMLGIMFSGRHNLDQDADGNYLIDRDGTHFNYILNFIRNDGDLPPAAHAEQVLNEAMYYGIEPLIQHIKELPPLFAEYVVRERIREKLNHYSHVKDLVVTLARDQVLETNTVISVIKLVVSKNQPIPRDLQFSKQAYKQYYRQFKTYDSFQSCFGKYYVNLTTDQIQGNPKEVMGMIVGCLCHDLVREGYKCQYKPESIFTVPGNRMKTISWCDEEFHVCVTCHEFQFNWLDVKVHLDTENNHEPRRVRFNSSD